MKKNGRNRRHPEVQQREWAQSFLASSFLLASIDTCSAFSFFSPSRPTLAEWTHALEHLFSPPLQLQATPLEKLTNVRIPNSNDRGVDILAYKATPSEYKGNSNEQGTTLPSIILIHEFFGLSPSIVEKAQGLADELGCIVIAPDTFRGEVTDFIPKAIWLALTTPQDRVNEDLNAVCSYLEGEAGNNKLAVMGFCYGGGKAIRYTTQCRPEAATVIYYGSPLTDMEVLSNLNAPVCGIYGSKDAQFSMALLDKFRAALVGSNVEHDVRVYDGVGHAFWTDMGQVERGEEPQTRAYEQCTSFLRQFFFE